MFEIKYLFFEYRGIRCRSEILSTIIHLAAIPSPSNLDQQLKNFLLPLYLAMN